MPATLIAVSEKHGAWATFIRQATVDLPVLIEESEAGLATLESHPYSIALVDFAGRTADAAEVAANALGVRAEVVAVGVDSDSLRTHLLESGAFAAFASSADELILQQLIRNLVGRSQERFQATG